MDDEPVRRPGVPTVAAAVLRSILSIAGLLFVYFRLPVTGRLDGGPWWPVAALILLAVLCVLQVRGIVRSRHPMLRAMEALSVSAPLYVLLFAATYFLMSTNHPAGFTEPLSRMDALYFAVTVLTTTGFGDIAAVDTAERVVVTVQLVGGVGFVAVVGRIFVSAVRRGLNAHR